MNSAIHGYADGKGGEFDVTVSRIDGDDVRIVCSDSGVGIEARNRDRIFDPFFTTRREQWSVGLGLHIVHNIVVETFSGKIDLVSTCGQGTIVTIDIPANIVRF